MFSSLIDDLLERRSVAPERILEAMTILLDGDADPAAAAGLLVALRTRPPDAVVLASIARAMRARRVAFRCRVRPLIDTCGTGGDGSRTFNISTAAAFLVAACGGAVAKHGNRAVSSRSGSADVLEALGVDLDLPPPAVADLVDACGFGFLFAQRFHPGMAHLAPVRRSLAIRTHLNLVGPLASPALADYQLVGVARPEWTRPMAEALSSLGTRGALVLHCDGLDEIGLHAPTRGHRVREGEVEPFEIDPVDLGLDRAPISALRGGDARENARIIRCILDGEGGPRADVVALNAAAALSLAGLYPGVRPALEACFTALRDGSARRVLDRVIESGARLQEAGR